MNPDAGNKQITTNSNFRDILMRSNAYHTRTSTFELQPKYPAIDAHMPFYNKLSTQQSGQITLSLRSQAISIGDCVIFEWIQINGEDNILYIPFQRIKVNETEDERNEEKNTLLIILIALSEFCWLIVWSA